jgi:hypothetical protein
VKDPSIAESFKTTATPFDYAILSNDVKLLRFLLRLMKKSPILGNIYRLAPDQLIGRGFRLATQFKRLELIQELIRHWGYGIPTPKEDEAEEGTPKKANKFYQGLSIGGKKRTDWAVARGQGPKRSVVTENMSLALNAAQLGSPEIAEYFLSDKPRSCYEEYLKLNPEDEKAEIAVSKGLLSNKERWWNQNGECQSLQYLN